MSPSSLGSGTHSYTMWKCLFGFMCVSKNTQSKSWASNIRTRARRNVCESFRHNYYSMKKNDRALQIILVCRACTCISFHTSSSRPVAAVWCWTGTIRQWPSVRDTPFGRHKYTCQKMRATVRSCIKEDRSHSLSAVISNTQGQTRHAKNPLNTSVWQMSAEISLLSFKRARH